VPVKAIMLKESNLQMENGTEALRKREIANSAGRAPARKTRWGLGFALVLGLAAIVLVFTQYHRKAKSTSAGGVGAPAGGPGRGNAGPVPVIAGTVTAQDFPIYLDGLGTVQAFNTVAVRARVDGQLQRIYFTEGQEIQNGALLAQIDPAPFQAQLDQNAAKKAEDEAQLAVARLNLKRNADLLRDKIVSQQEYDTSAALVDQLIATVKADQAAIDNAKVQLDYTRISAPLEGRVGMRLVDQGNIVHANDSNGIVVITQLRPISVVFTLAERYLSDLRQQMASGGEMTVLAVSGNNRNVLAEGKLSVVDNQIDTTTGTIRLKAAFANEKLQLWPGQFVNARLLLTVRHGALVVPAQVVQRGPEGSSFAYLIKPDSSVVVQPVKVGALEQNQAWIEEGLQLGDKVVVDGQYKLQPGSKVKLSEGNEGGAGGGRRATTGSSGKASPPSP
jgi:membrane fusion protein, multidrug efflux system